MPPKPDFADKRDSLKWDLDHLDEYSTPGAFIRVSNGLRYFREWVERRNQEYDIRMAHWLAANRTARSLDAAATDRLVACIEQAIGRKVELIDTTNPTGEEHDAAAMRASDTDSDGMG